MEAVQRTEVGRVGNAAHERDACEQGPVQSADNRSHL